MIRPGSRADINELVNLEQQCFKHGLSISRRSFRRFLRIPSADLLVAQRRGKVVAYALVSYWPSSARLYSLAVSRNCRRQGIGKKLLRAVEKRAAERASIMRLEVNERNATALWLYRNAGYQVVDRIERYYPDGATALRMQKGLAPPP
jgi:ribosomal-protein-alanine acetyltransferase